MKTYFANGIGELSEEFSYTLETILEEMRDWSVDILEVFEAKREIQSDGFFCKDRREVFLQDDNPCGKHCSDYAPRNGNGGCCKHRGYCYERGRRFRLKVNGKLTRL